MDDYDGNTYRVVYTVRFANAVYVLHAFQKKSKKGKVTPPADLKTIKTRLKAAETHYKEIYATKNEKLRQRFVHLPKRAQRQ